jgi:hypothetical protein
VSFLPHIDKEKLEQTLAAGDDFALFDLLAEPLHEELYRRQEFHFMDELTEGQQLILSYDYLRSQVAQGGFIQFLVNGYIGLLPEMPGWLQRMGAHEMAQVVDDAIKVYVLNHDLFSKDLSNEKFAKLYEELKEFEIIDSRFATLNDATIHIIMEYARTHINEFAS